MLHGDVPPVPSASRAAGGARGFPACAGACGNAGKGRLGRAALQLRRGCAAPAAAAPPGAAPRLPVAGEGRRPRAPRSPAERNGKAAAVWPRCHFWGRACGARSARGSRGAENWRRAFLVPICCLGEVSAPQGNGKYVLAFPTSLSWRTWSLTAACSGFSW